MEDKKKTEHVPEERRVHSVHVEPLVKNIYIMKALQSSSQPDTLTWDSVGDQVNYNTDGSIIMQEWKRRCMFLCSSDDFGNKPGYFLTDYDGFYVLPSYGNKLFKAVMFKIAHDLALPPYTSATIDVEVYLGFSKFADSSSSSTWVGAITMDWDHCKTIGKNNNEHGKWSGVPSSEVYFSTEYNLPAFDAHCLNVFGTRQTADNTSDIMQHHLLAPIYLMSMIERPKSYSTYLGVGDIRPDEKIIVTPQFTSLIAYNDNEVQKYIYSDRKSQGIFLKKPERAGHIMKGWLDSVTGRLYPAGGYYAEKRGVKLAEQWIEDVVPYTVKHYYANRRGEYQCKTETLYYMAGGTVCPTPDQDPVYETPAPVTVCVAADGSTEIEYRYEIAEYPVQYCANGGHFKDGSDFKQYMVAYGLNISPIENQERVKRTGYRFLQWDPVPEVMFTSTIVSRAVWEAYQYTVKFDGNGADSGTMEPQGFIYDQPQKLNKNKYECMHTVSFAVGDRRGDNAYFKPQTVGCYFKGWSEVENGEKIYDDRAVVCNLSSDNNGEKTLYAVWESASIHLPQLYYEGYYFDAWYTDESFTDESRVGEPGDEYIPDGDVTLYGRLLSIKEAKDLKWVQGEEPVEERTIKAEWSPVEGATSYLVGLEDEVGKQNFPLRKEDFPDSVNYIDPGAVEVTGCELDFTETLKRFTAGGNFNFSVMPVIPDAPQESIKRSVSPGIRTLARPENLGWDEETRTIAMWEPVEGADYYLVWIYYNESLIGSMNMGIELYPSLLPYMHDDSSIQISDTKADLSEVTNMLVTIQYRVLGYSKDELAYYTPQYEVILSDPSM